MKHFKKVITFLIAAVLLIMTAAPAADAFAAATPKLNTASKTLYVGGSTVSATKGYYNLKIKNKPSSYTAVWSVDDDDVVKLTKISKGKYRVDAVGIGSAVVTVIVKDKAAGRTYQLEAKFKVKKNCASISLAPLEDFTLKYGETKKLTAAMLDAAGNQVTKNRQVTDTLKWVSSDTKVAIVSGGKVTAVGAGTATITAYSVQATTGTYKDLAHCTASESVRVTVEQQGIIAIKQTTLNTVRLTFGGDYSKTINTDNIAFNGSNGMIIAADKIKFSEDGTVADITGKIDFMEGIIYTVTDPKTGSSTYFTASKGKPVTMELYTDIGGDKVIAGTNATIRFRLLNAEGVDITPTSTVSSDYITYASYIECSRAAGFENGAWYAFGTTAYIAEAGKSFDVVGVYDDHNGTKFNAAIKLTAVTEASTKTLDGVLVTNKTGEGSSFDWKKPSQVVSISDITGYRLVARVKNYDGEYIYSSDAGSKITFKVPNPNALIISDGANGTVYPYRKGTESVQVYYDGTLIGAVSLQVVDARTVSSLRVYYGDEPATTITMSAQSGVSEANLTVKAFDQYNCEIAIASGDITVTPEKLTSPYTIVTVANGTANIETNAAYYGTTAGSEYTYTVAYNNAVYGKTQTGYRLKVYTPNVLLTSNYKVEVSGPTDMALSKLTELPRINIVVYEMKGNVKYSKITDIYSSRTECSTGDYFYKLVKGEDTGTAITSGVHKGYITPIVTASQIATKYRTGAYIVSVYQRGATSDTYVGGTGFKLTDSDNDITYTVKSRTTSQALSTAMTTAPGAATSVFNECFSVAMGGTLITSGIEVTKCVASADMVFFQEIKVSQTVTVGDTNYIVFYPVEINVQVNYVKAK